MTPTNRSRFVHAGIPFVIPGKHVHMPFLGVSASEARGCGLRKAPGRFDTVTQLAYLAACDNVEPVGTNRLAGLLGCSKMSVSRAFRTISELNLGRILKDGREHSMVLYGKNGVEAFRNGLPYLRSPIAEKFIVYDDGFSKDFMVSAGETALAEFSMLEEPAHPVFATDRKGWRELVPGRGLKLARVHDSDTVEIEVWRYPPWFMSKSLDGFSLYLSLMGSDDDPRLEDALDDLLETMLNKQEAHLKS